MPMIDPKDHPDLALLTFSMMTYHIQYLFDPRLYDSSKTIKKNFRCAKSKIHVAVLCAQFFDQTNLPGRDESTLTYEVTNVKSSSGYSAGPAMYYIALDLLGAIRPDRSITSDRAKKIWDRLREDKRVYVDSRGTVYDNRTFSSIIDAEQYFDMNQWNKNFARFIIQQSRSYGLSESVVIDKIVDQIIDGFAVVQMDEV